MSSKVSAYIRVKDEINTIEACLKSIDGVFDRVVIIHSNEKDDGTVDYINRWCEHHSNYEVYEYPHQVIPSHDKMYLGEFDNKNTLAAYNNFGLEFFDDEEYVIKIDADQIYINSLLNEAIERLKNENADNVKYALKGYNTFIWNNKLVKYADTPINGYEGDSYFIKRKYMDKFIHNGLYESLILKDIKQTRIWYKPLWFHFMKTIKQNCVIRENNSLSENEVSFLQADEINIFEQNIRPLLKNSVYYEIEV